MVSYREEVWLKPLPKIIFYFRKSKMLRGSNIYITEDFSKRIRDRRAELQKFMKELKKR